MKLGWRSGLVVAAVLSVVGGFLVMSGPQPEAVKNPDATPAPRPALTVSVVRPERVEWPDSIQASGSIAAWQEAIVGAEVTGLRLDEILVDVGDQVAKGQVLAQFDDATVQAMVRQMQAAVAEAEANVAEAKANADRADRLGQTGVLSRQDATQYLTRARTADAQLESARARLHSQKLALEYTKVVAPDDGVIVARQATLGMVAAPGAELFRLVRQNRLEWRAELSGDQLAKVRVGDVASVTLADGSVASGRVRQVAPALDENRRIGLAYVELDRDTAVSTAARAGMYGSGTVTLGSRAALTVPADAIVLRDGHEYVFVLGADDRVALTRVAVDRRVGNGVEISGGIDEAQSVVASGAAFLNDADLVRVVPAAGVIAEAGDQT